MICFCNAGLQLKNTSLCNKKREQEFRYLAYDNDFMNLQNRLRKKTGTPATRRPLPTL